MSSINKESLDKEIVHVAVAVINDSHGQFLIAKRANESHQGGLWEFPGGKVEAGESVLEALRREIFEEIGIKFIQATPLIRICHNYSDKRVLLDVWSISEYTEKAFAKENQEVRWVSQDDIPKYKFPAANNAIIKAIQLPDKYLITGEFQNENELLTRTQSALDEGIRLIQFRAHELEKDTYLKYAENIYKMCQKYKAKLLLNTPFNVYVNKHAEIISDGLHLTAKELVSFIREDLFSGLLISASTHNEKELQLAEERNIDFVVLSPVNKTKSHPNSIPLGWGNFHKLTEQATIPVFALGGMTKNDITTAKEYGGQGVSGISTFWDGKILDD